MIARISVKANRFLINRDVKAQQYPNPLLPDPPGSKLVNRPDSLRHCQLHQMRRPEPNMYIMRRWLLPGRGKQCMFLM